MNIREVIQTCEENKLLSLSDKELRLFLKDNLEYKNFINNLYNPLFKNHVNQTHGDKLNKIYRANKGKIMSDESKLKISKANKGKGHPCSDESKLKISLSKLGKPRSEETKRKLSEAHKKRHSYNKDSTKKLYQEVSINPLPIYNEIYKEEFPL